MYQCTHTTDTSMLRKFCRVFGSDQVSLSLEPKFYGVFVCWVGLDIS